MSRHGSNCGDERQAKQDHEHRRPDQVPIRLLLGAAAVVVPDDAQALVRQAQNRRLLVADVELKPTGQLAIGGHHVHRHTRGDELAVAADLADGEDGDLRVDRREPSGADTAFAVVPLVDADTPGFTVTKRLDGSMRPWQCRAGSGRIAAAPLDRPRRLPPPRSKRTRNGNRPTTGARPR